MAIRDYAKTSLSKADAAEVGSMFKEMRKDWLKGVERNPSPTIDLAAGRGIMSDRASGGMFGNDAGVLFPGRIARQSFAKDTLPSIESMFKEINKRTVEREYPTSRNAEKYPAGFAPRTTKGAYPMVQYPVDKYPVKNYPAGYTGKSGYPQISKYPGSTYPEPYPKGGNYPVDYPSYYPVTTGDYPRITTGDYPKITTTDYPKITDYPKVTITNYPHTQPYKQTRFGRYTLLPTTTRLYPPPPSITYIPKKKKYGKKGKARQAEEHYIWNETPSLASVFGSGVSMPWASMEAIMSNQFKYPGPGKPKKLPAYFSEKPRF